MRGLALFALAAAPLATGASAQPDPRTPAVLSAVRAQLGEIGSDARFAIAFSDLNDDHRPEAVVHLVDRDHCGSGGCTTLILTEGSNGWRLIGRMSVSRLPIYRLPTRHNGWFDLGVSVGGGGIQSGLRAVRMGKGRYSSNPTTSTVVVDLPLEASPLIPADSEFTGIAGS